MGLESAGLATGGGMEGRSGHTLMASVARVAATLNSERDPDRVLDLVCGEASAIFAADTTMLWVPQGGDLVAVHTHGLFADQLRGFRVPMDDPETFACRSFRQRSPIIENDLHPERCGNRLIAQLAPATSVLCVPMVHMGETLGVLGFRESDGSRRFTRADLDAASIFGDLAAVAVANARLQREAERRAAEAAALSRIARIVSSGQGLAETSEAFAKELRNLVFFHRVAIAILEDEQSYRIFLVRGLDAEGFLPGQVRALRGSGVEWVVKNRRPHVIKDLELERISPSDHVYAAARMRSVARVPLIERGEPLGCLTVVSAEPGAYGPREVELLEQVAAQIAGVFANARMVEIERGLVGRLSAIHRITDAALSTLDLENLVTTLLDRCIEVTSADGGIILLLDESGQELGIRGARWMPGEQPRDVRRRLGEGISGKVALHGVARLIWDVDEEDPADVVLTKERGIRSLMAIPLKARGRTIGVFRLESRRPAHFQPAQMQLMETAAERMALAIDNARLMRESQERAAHEAMIHRIATAIGASLDLNRVVGSTLEELLAATSVTRCAVALVPSVEEHHWSLWEARSDRGAPRPTEPVPWWNETMVRLRRSSREPIAIEDVLDAPVPSELRELAEKSGVRAVLSVPIPQGDELLGSLELQQLGASRRWTDREIDLARAVAAQLALAVRNARLYEETDERLRARVRDLSSLLRLGQAVSEQLSLDLVMERAVEEGVRTLDADRCTVTTVDRERGLLTVRAAAHRGAEATDGVGLELPLSGFPHSARALASREPAVFSAGDPALSREEASMMKRLGLARGMVVPLVVGDRAIGSYFVGRRAGGRGFSQEEVAMAVAMAGQVAVAMENARLFQEVQEQKARTEALLASMSEGVLAVDTRCRITAVNPWMEAMVGWRAKDMVGKECRHLLQHSDEEGHPICDTACPIREAMESGMPTEPVTVFTQTAWGERVPTIVSAAPIRDGGTGIQGAVSVSRDVSREWQMDKLRSNIISVVSHEFRTPLTSVIGFSELLLTRDQTEEERRSCAEYIYNEGLKLESLVNDFLDVSRLGAGKVMLEPQRMEPSTIVQEAIQAARRLAPDRVFLMEIQEGLPTVMVDPRRFAQVMENLLSNAIKYSAPDTGITVRARLGRRSGDGEVRIGGDVGEPWVVFTVEDRGFGIPDDQLSEIFAPFHRVYGELTRRIRGTGLGLTIVKSLVELHGGRAWVESRLGVGSSFHVALKADGGGLCCAG